MVLPLLPLGELGSAEFVPLSYCERRLLLLEPVLEPEEPVVPARRAGLRGRTTAFVFLRRRGACRRDVATRRGGAARGRAPRGRAARPRRLGLRCSPAQAQQEERRACDQHLLHVSSS